MPVADYELVPEKLRKRSDPEQFSFETTADVSALEEIIGQERAVREALLERWGTPQDVAAAARFLVSPSAAFITGQVIPVNGGFRYGD